MKYWMILLCVVLAGCKPSGSGNVVDTSDQAAMEAYEAAIAEGDRMQAGDKDFKD